MNARLILLALVLFAAAAATAHPPVSVVIDGQGNAYYSDLHQVWKVAPDGSKTVAVPGVHTHELYLDAQGNLFGEHLWYEGERTDKWGHYLWRRSPDGKVVKLIPDREGFPRDYSFVRDRAGNQYYADEPRKRVLKLAPDGKVTIVASNFTNIRWMISAPDGTLHVIDNSDLVRVTPAGAATRVARKLGKASRLTIPAGPNHAVMGLWTDRAGNVYAASYAEDVVKKITPGGTVSVVLESQGIWSPVGGAFAANGDLLLLEWSVRNDARLRRIPASGLRVATR